MIHRLLITASRTITAQHQAQVYGVLRDAREKWRDPGAVLVHGAAKGGDTLAARIWGDLWGMPTEPHPADWVRHGRRAGYVRNAEMVALGATRCVALLMPCVKLDCPVVEPHPSHGAAMCADLAERAAIPTHRCEIRA